MTEQQGDPLVQEQGGIDIWSYLRIVLDYKWLIILSTVLFGGSTIYALTFVVHSYSATTTLAIDMAELQSLTISQIYGTRNPADQYDGGRGFLEELTSTQLQVLSSREVAERLVDALDLKTHPEYAHLLNEDGSKVAGALAKAHIYFDKDTRARMKAGDRLPDDGQPLSERQRRKLTEALMERIEIMPIPATQLVLITVYSYDPNLALEAANAFPNAYVDTNLEARMKKAEIESRWLAERVGTLKVKLNDSIARLQAYKERQSLVDIEGVNALASERLRQLNTDLVSVRNDLSELRAVNEQLAQAFGNTSRMLAIEEIASDSLVMEHRSAFATAKRRVEELGKRYGPKHQRMIDARSELTATERRLASSVQTAAAVAERGFEAAIESERDLVTEIQNTEQEFQTIDRKTVELEELQREVDINRELYTLFYNRSRQTAEAVDLQKFIAQVVERAIFPEHPALPKRKLIALGALIFGVMFGVGIAGLLWYFDNTFMTSQDVSSKLQMPLLGLVPKINDLVERSPEDVSKLTFLDEKQARYAEAIRTIRTGVILSALSTPQKTILVTSTHSNEGKTSLAVNLAVAMGQTDQKVLLIDADMRRPSIAKMLGLSPTAPGLSNLVAGMSSFTESIVHVEGIDILPAGLIPPNPLELLSSEKFKGIMASLEDVYDRIIIDSAPLQAVSDSLLISTISSSVLYVLRAEKTTVKSVRMGMARLRQAQAPIAGVVLSMVNVKKSSISDSDLGGYYDYYGYGEGKPHSSFKKDT